MRKEEGQMRSKIIVIGMICFLFILGMTSAIAVEPVKVGVISVLSGPLAVVGKGEARCDQNVDRRIRTPAGRKG